MISIIKSLFEIEIDKDQFKNEFELVRWAKQKGIIPRNKRSLDKPKCEDGEWLVPLKEKKVFTGINPKTNRKKKIKKIKYIKTDIPPEERTLKNLPRYANKKAKVRFQDWLGLKNTSKSNHSVGQAYDGKWYGWSHRAIHGFGIGDIIKPDHIGNKYEYGKEIDKKYNQLEKTKGREEAEKWRKSLAKFKPYKIKTDQEAFEHAERFARDVS